MSHIKYDSRICFGIDYYDDESEAKREGNKVRESGATYNGGFYHGRPCGRDDSWDYFDKKLGKKLYAVTS